MHKMGAWIFSRQVVFAICNQWTEQQIELFENFIIWFPGTNWETINLIKAKWENKRILFIKAGYVSVSFYYHTVALKANFKLS